MADKCNFRKCLDQKNGLCTANEKEIFNGRCQSIAWADKLGTENAPPVERRNGSLRRPGRVAIK